MKAARSDAERHDTVRTSEDMSSAGHSNAGEGTLGRHAHRSGGRYTRWGVLLLLAIAGGWLAFPSLSTVLSGRDRSTTRYVLETVRRGPFRITVTERGTIDSSENSTISNSVEGTTTIIWIIPEGEQVQGPQPAEIAGRVVAVSEPSGGRVYITTETEDGRRVDQEVSLGEWTRVLVEVGDTVKQGDRLAADLLCELDSSSLQDLEKQQQITVTQSEANLKKGEENVEIQKRQNESDQAAARLQMELAQLDLQSYLEGDAVATENELKGEVLLAREELAQKMESYEFAKRISKKGYKSQNELEQARIAVTQARNKLNVSEGKLDVQMKYTYRRTLKELQENAEESGRELERVTRSGIAALAQFEAELKACKLTHEVEMAKLERLQKQIQACWLYAPQDGQVVYQNEQSRRSEPTVIEEGATVRERQTIIKLPDLTKMKVDARIHESKISQIRVGLPVLVHVDAVHNQVFNGEVQTVSAVPLPGNWPNYDLKEYECDVYLTDPPSKLGELKPGLTANIEIIVKERDDDVLQVPVQAIVTIGEKRYAYAISDGEPQRRELQIGDTNETAVEILDGLKEGERIVMNPRTAFAKELAELEARFAQKNRESQGEAADGEQQSAEAAVPADTDAGAAAPKPRQGAGGARKGRTP